MNTIKRDVYVLRNTIKIPIEVTKGTDAISFEFTVRDYNLPATAAAVAYAYRMGMKKPNSTLCDVSGNVISFQPSANFFGVGNNELQIRVINEDKSLISFKERVKCSDAMGFPDDEEEKQQTLIEQLLSNSGKETEERKKADETERNERTAAIEKEKNERTQADATEKSERKAEIDVERKRIDNLAKLPAGSTTGDAELKDIRVGADGTIYGNAGEAVRQQVGLLKEDLDKLYVANKTLYTIENTKDWAVNGTIVGSTNKPSENKMLFVLMTDKSRTPEVTIRGLVGGTYSGNNTIMSSLTFNGSIVHYGLITPKETETEYWLTSGSALSNVYFVLNIYEYPEDLTNDEMLSLLKNMSEDYTLNLYGEIIAKMSNDVETIKETANEAKELANEALNGKSQTKIVCWGDSETQGVGATTSGGYVTLLKNQLSEDGYNYSVLNRGVSGDNLNNIMNRMGAVPIYIKPFTMLGRNGENVYTPIQFYETPFGKVNFAFPYDVTAGVRPCYLNGVQYGTSGVFKSDGNYRWIRTEDGEDIIFDKPVLFTHDNQKLNDQITIIWGGTNDLNMTIEEMILRQKAMIDYLKTDKFVIIGLVADIRHDVLIYNKALGKQWGRKFLDVQKYLVEYGLSDNGLTPTDDDNTKIESGLIPRQLMINDELHFNEYGHIAIKNCLYAYLKNEGYIVK